MFQIWLNLPKAKRLAEAHFAMLWSEDIPKERITDENGNETEVTVIAGSLGNSIPVALAPDSWASDPANEVVIWTIKMEPNAKWQIPMAAESSNRTIYFFNGLDFKIGEEQIEIEQIVSLNARKETTTENGNQEDHFLLLQGKSINGSVAQYGPFVMKYTIRNPTNRQRLSTNTVWGLATLRL